MINNPDVFTRIFAGINFPEREIDSNDAPKGRLIMGQVIQKVYPHGDHKGNMRVYWAKVNGREGSAQCVMKDCGVVVRLKVASAN